VNSDGATQLAGLQRVFVIGACLAVQLLAGCSGDLSVPATVPVKGVVTYKGKPVLGVRVKFFRQDGQHENAFIPTGETDKGGQFALSTGAPLNGAPEGQYNVAFEWPMLDPKQAVETEIDKLKGKYSDPAKSKFQVTVDGSKSEPHTFALD